VSAVSQFCREGTSFWEELLRRALLLTDNKDSMIEGTVSVMLQLELAELNLEQEIDGREAIEDVDEVEVFE
jgi:hypothetical protein